LLLPRCVLSFAQSPGADDRAVAEPDELLLGWSSARGHRDEPW